MVVREWGAWLTSASPLILLNNFIDLSSSAFLNSEQLDFAD